MNILVSNDDTDLSLSSSSDSDSSSSSSDSSTKQNRNKSKKSINNKCRSTKKPKKILITSTFHSRVAEEKNPSSSKLYSSGSTSTFSVEENNKDSSTNTLSSSTYTSTDKVGTYTSTPRTASTPASSAPVSLFSKLYGINRPTLQQIHAKEINSLTSLQPIWNKFV